MSRPRTVAVNSSRNSMIRQGLQRLARLTFLWTAILFPISVHAQTYDAASEFSGISSSTGVWSYGSKPVSNLATGTFTYYPNAFNYGPVRLWTHSPSIDVPFLSRNTDTINPFNDGLTLWTPGQLVLHAGNATASVLRFTVPITGEYNLFSTFSNQSGSFSGTNFYIYINSSLWYTSSLGAFGDSISVYNGFFPFSFNAGDTMEFMVGPRNDTSYNSTSTGLDVQISVAAVPEPATYALIGLSAVAGGGVFWYRRRQQQRLADQAINLS
ncbi:MAG: PEP-CTERM sorting domain-containing protein [Gemmatales bacterium]